MSNEIPKDLKDLKVEFAPGVLEQLEGEMSLEDLQEFMDEIKSRIQDGSFFDESTLVDMDALREEDPELYKKLSEFDEVYEGGCDSPNHPLH